MNLFFFFLFSAKQHLKNFLGDGLFEELNQLNVANPLEADSEKSGIKVSLKCAEFSSSEASEGCSIRRENLIVEEKRKEKEQIKERKQKRQKVQKNGTKMRKIVFKKLKSVVPDGIDDAVGSEVHIETEKLSSVFPMSVTESENVEVEPDFEKVEGSNLENMQSKEEIACVSEHLETFEECGSDDDEHLNFSSVEQSTRLKTPGECFFFFHFKFMRSLFES